MQEVVAAIEEQSSTFKTGEFIVGLSTSGICPSGLIGSSEDMVAAGFLIPATVRQSNEENRQIPTEKVPQKHKTKFLK